MLEYCSSVWNVGYLGDVRKVESLQRRWTREIVGMSGVSYSDRLRRLNLYSIYGRLLRRDMIRIWKILHSEEDADLLELLDVNVSSRVRGHRFRLRIPICRSDVRRRSFGVRCVNLWNELSSEVVESECVDGFKRLLDVSLGNRLFAIL